MIHGRPHAQFALPSFAPLDGQLVRAAGGSGHGWWAGAPGAYHDADSGLTWLTYRLREPRPVRGGVTRIAVSRDGVAFDDVLELRKEQLGADSIERCALRRGPDGRWRWFISYVDPADSRWRIDVVTADSPEQLDPAQRRPLFTAADVPGLEGIKDPYLFGVGGLTYLLTSIGLPVEWTADQLAARHATGDIFNTGLTISSTGVAVSADLDEFRWLGPIETVRGAWDSYCLRLNTVLWTPPCFTAFYDGSASVAENYEERCGLAQSFDLLRWERVSTAGPLVTVPHGSGSVRYVDVLDRGEQRLAYYELVRPDGAHELRVCPL